MKDDALEIWKDTLSNRPESTKQLYLRTLHRFLEWTGVSANEVRQLKLEEEQDPNKKPWQRTEVENLVRRYLGWLESQGKSGGTRRAALTAIRSFFKAQQLPLRLNREDFPDCAYMHASSVPSREDVKKMLDACTCIRDRALILFLKDSGLRESDLPQLQWKDLKEYPEGFVGFKLETKKKHVKARGFVGPETIEVLEIYKRSRLQGTQKIPPEENLMEHPVFSLLYDGSKPFQPKSMSDCIGRVIERAGLKEKGLTPHGLRKFWEQNVHTEKPSYAKQLNGRKLDAMEKSYEWKATEELFNIYRENYPNLRLRESVSEEVEKLRQEYETELKNLRNRLNIMSRELERRIDVDVRLATLEAGLQRLENALRAAMNSPSKRFTEELVKDILRRGRMGDGQKKKTH